MMKIRYSFIQEVVNDLFFNLNIQQYPIDIFSIYSHYKNIKVIPYSKYMEQYNLSSFEVLQYFGSDEGCALFNKNKYRYQVVFNDLSINFKTQERRYWTLAHELGHILLNHHILNGKTKLFRNTLTQSEYNILESEANYFASFLLANPVILDKLPITNYKDIATICHLSKEASKNRFNFLLHWKGRDKFYPNKIHLIKHFDSFINKHYCPICKYTNIQSSFNFCPICGSNILKWGDGTMIYTSIELNEKHKTKICPECENELTDIDGDFCQICGSTIVNKCTNHRCQNLLDGNMRYCPECGSKSTLLEQKFLENWKTEKVKLEQEQLEAEYYQNNSNSSNNSDDSYMPF